LFLLLFLGIGQESHLPKLCYHLSLVSATATMVNTSSDIQHNQIFGQIFGVVRYSTWSDIQRGRTFSNVRYSSQQSDIQHSTQIFNMLRYSAW